MDSPSNSGGDTFPSDAPPKGAEATSNPITGIDLTDEHDDYPDIYGHSDSTGNINES